MTECRLSPQVVRRGCPMVSCRVATACPWSVAFVAPRADAWEYTRRCPRLLSTRPRLAQLRRDDKLTKESTR